MNEYKVSLWISNIFTIFIAIALVFAVKFLLNPLLTQQQESIGQSSALTQLPHIQNLSELSAAITDKNFTFIKISDDELSTPIIYNNDSEHMLFSHILPISTSITQSTVSNQTIEYQTVNNSLFILFRSLIFLIIVGLLAAMIICNVIYFRLLKKIEQSLVDEITNVNLDADEPKERAFTKVSNELLEKNRSFNELIKEQEERILQLTNQANQDNLTGLNNRHCFRKELIDFLSSNGPQAQAVLAIIRLHGLAEINNSRGFQQADEYIIDITNIIKRVISKYNNISAFRMSGSDFSLIANNMSTANTRLLCQEIQLKFDEYQSLNNLDSVACIGLATIFSGQPPEEVLARADLALAKAQYEGGNSWQFIEEDDDQTKESTTGQQHWRLVLENIITRRTFSLLQQSVLSINKNMTSYRELSVRFIGENHNVIPTNTVFAMAQRMDLTIKLEQAILEQAVSAYKRATEGNVRWGLKINSSVIQNSSFIVWLERLLLREPDFAASLILEVEEQQLENSLIAGKRLFEMLKRCGSRSAICNFGKGIGSLQLFQQLSPNFVKVDANLIKNIQRDSSNQQFLRMIIDVAHRMDCKVIADRVEDVEQKQILEGMYIDGLQGFLIARPTSI